ncbi:class II aldolase/adducin family protein [Bordetella sp. BOR01]|uniref:class II aldolase/adducin family protein n=1 Tax=Bordetella sp. BOR01 TaxID=2854779 RepID=UPI001C49011F|nr:class II aldolase/adducin family protein [Bordetella sp. BOR01]MBV7486535.1 class II aldolase/adducin family protein [Bordetella sp. BOR01]
MHVTQASQSDQAQRTRCELAALYRLVAHFRMTDLIYTHISARLPGAEHRFLINRYGVLFDEMRASDLVEVDLDGNVAGGSSHQAHSVNRAGFVIHSAIHAARPDMHFVIHTHTAAGIAVSAQKHGLLPISQFAMKFYRRIGYHGYEGVALELGERERLVRDLGSHRAMILRNHGLLAGGRTASEAFLTMLTLERACQAQVQAMAAGMEALNFPADEVCERAARQTNPQDIPAHYEMAWNAALRLIEAQPPDYRT